MCEIDSVDKSPLSLSDDLVLPWLWDLKRCIKNMTSMRTHKGNPWKTNHHVDLWLLWNMVLFVAVTFAKSQVLCQGKIS